MSTRLAFLGATFLFFLRMSVVEVVGAERPVDPTFLYRNLGKVSAGPSEITTATCRYHPLFGQGDAVTSIVKGVARFGQIVVEPGGQCKEVSYAAEEQAYFVLEGSGEVSYGESRTGVKREDFMYLAPGSRHGLSNPSGEPLRVVVMGYHIPEGTPIQAPEKLLIANTADAKKQVVGNHPPSTLYQLLMGDVHSKRDILAAGHVLTSLFIMEFAPGGTNHPHHHPTEEEIYLVLNGEGEIVAGGGMDGIEGRHPVQGGDAYFYRLNCTVGFYASEAPGLPKARILAVRSRFPQSAR